MTINSTLEPNANRIWSASGIDDSIVTTILRVTCWSYWLQLKHWQYSMSLGLAMKAMRTEMHKSEMQIYLSRTKHTANGKNASGKTKNNFTEELFQLFLHACKRLKGQREKRTNWNESKRFFRITLALVLIINNKSLLFQRRNIFPLLLTCYEINVSSVRLWILFLICHVHGRILSMRKHFKMPVKIQFKKQHKTFLFSIVFSFFALNCKLTEINGIFFGEMQHTHHQTKATFEQLLFCWD